MFGYSTTRQTNWEQFFLGDIGTFFLGHPIQRFCIFVSIYIFIEHVLHKKNDLIKYNILNSAYFIHTFVTHAYK